MAFSQKKKFTSKEFTAMLMLLSPAKIQNTKLPKNSYPATIPQFLDDAEYLVEKVRELSLRELAQLLGVNSQLAELNRDRFYSWHRPFTVDNARQAVLVYNGEVFRGLNAASMTENELTYLQQHLRILSGLYGVLRPLDLIQPYRLEISSRLPTFAGNDLYDFWGKKITDAVSQAFQFSGQPEILLNLCSSEYIKAIDRDFFDGKIVDIEFLENDHGNFRPIVVYLKKARGLMVRYVAQYRIENVEDLKGFDVEGYWYHPELSNDNKMVFVRG
ncbi:MAG TPA: peroxide stress protein YaaA [Paludibacteraceae bacterium]|nr:peroxide stress protein YaaA [Paludibacteraceae bacterium]HON02500.1 peroxide stress protein YaaA [Paludibacteraceae bacterium]HQG67057.1 peroxide stress protein YaaA [Paludibacteraceae bacterium]HRT78522.1 peroxide stress protein YaaA [Paludibacteraceae bacterium]